MLINQKDTREKLRLTQSQFELASKRQELQRQKKIAFQNKIIWIISTLLLLSLGFFAYQRNKNRILKNENEMIELEGMVLRSQMNPHFIFNALTAIQNSLFDNDPMKSASYLSNFARLIRQNFEHISRK